MKNWFQINRRAFLALTGGTMAGTLVNEYTPLDIYAAEVDALALLGGFTWIRQSCFRIQNGEQVIYLDPYQVSSTPHDADYIFITHPHNDHADLTSVRNVMNDTTQIYAESDSADKLRSGVPGIQVIRLGEQRSFESVRVETVRAYNLTKTYHPRANDWLGFILTLQDGRRVYHAGDTDFIPEMEAMVTDVALLPIGGTYTMDAVEAADAVRAIKPQVAVPMHWGGSVGTEADARRFEQSLAGECDVLVMANGQSIPVQETRVHDWKKRVQNNIK